MVRQEFHCGDIIQLNFSPQSGHEQFGMRLAIIISNNILNQHSRMLMVCPITRTDKKHPFHVRLDEQTNTTGVILCDQAKMLDVISRGAVYIESAPLEIVNEVKEIIIQFIE